MANEDIGICHIEHRIGLVNAAKHFGARTVEHRESDIRAVPGRIMVHAERGANRTACRRSRRSRRLRPRHQHHPGRLRRMPLHTCPQQRCGASRKREAPQLAVDRSGILSKIQTETLPKFHTDAVPRKTSMAHGGSKTQLFREPTPATDFNKSAVLPSRILLRGAAAAKALP